MNPRPMPEWCADPGECARLIRWMHEHDEHGPVSIETVLEILEKPWHWDDEHQEMLREGLAAERAVR